MHLRKDPVAVDGILINRVETLQLTAAAIGVALHHHEVETRQVRMLGEVTVGRKGEGGLVGINFNEELHYIN